MDVLTARAERLAQLLGEDGISISVEDAERLVVAYELHMLMTTALAAVADDFDGPEAA